jgi:rubrerythrin
MKVEQGTVYTCEKCHCSLTATKAPESCPEECNLTCCGKLMQVKE